MLRAQGLAPCDNTGPGWAAMTHSPAVLLCWWGGGYSEEKITRKGQARSKAENIFSTMRIERGNLWGKTDEDLEQGIF